MATHAVRLVVAYTLLSLCFFAAAIVPSVIFGTQNSVHDRPPSSNGWVFMVFLWPAIAVGIVAVTYWFPSKYGARVEPVSSRWSL
jgi:hypothetical protein